MPTPAIKPPKFAKGDICTMHNQEGLVIIDFCWPSSELGKSHRYSAKPAHKPSVTLYGSGKGYYESVFKKATKKEVKAWERDHGRSLTPPVSSTSAS